MLTKPEPLLFAGLLLLVLFPAPETLPFSLFKAPADDALVLALMDRPVALRSDRPLVTTTFPLLFVGDVGADRTGDEINLVLDVLTWDFPCC
jgi:hypothetical protein